MLSNAAPQVSVVVPSYRRPERLRECLVSLAVCEPRPGEVVVALRPNDVAGIHVAETFTDLPVTIAWSREAGVLAAMSAGVRAARGQIVAFLDDDAAPHRDWLARMLLLFEDPEVGGAGGRDIVTSPDDLPRTPVAGMITAWGKLVGQHHRAIGPVRDVDVLKGANMAFRREALALPAGLLGEGAQVHFEVATCLWAKDRGWRLLLDPGAEVLHLPGERFDDDARRRQSPAATRRAAYNYTVCLLSLRPHLRQRRLVYGLLIGDRGMPGLVRACASVLQREPVIARRLVQSIAGQLQGSRAARRGQAVGFDTFPPTVP